MPYTYLDVKTEVLICISLKSLYDALYTTIPTKIQYQQQTDIVEIEEWRQSVKLSILRNKDVT